MKTSLMLLNMLLVGCIFFSSNYSFAQYVVDFEGTGETKTSYLSGTVTLSGLDWDMTQSLIGTLDNDKKNGSRSMRIRRSGSTQGIATMLSDKANGAGTISFLYARFGTDTDQPELYVEYSIDGGISWTQAGNAISSFPQDLTLWTTSINISGNVRIRLRTNTSGTNERRINIDDITITDFTSGCSAPSTQASGITFSSITENSMTVNWTNGNGNGRVVIMNTSNSFTAPASGSNPTANTSYSGSGEQVIFNGTGSSTVSITNLNPSTTYWFQIYEFCNPDRNYNITSATDNPNSVTTAVCSNNTNFFRSNATGDWSDASIWQTSVDGSTWTSTLCAPDFNANTISIRNGHTVTVSDALTVDQVVIENGGVLRHVSGSAMTLNNGTGDDLVIQNGGIWLFNGGNSPSYQNASVRVRVQTGGIIRISNNAAGISSNLAGNGSSNRIIYEHEAVFEWNNGTSPASSNQVYFPDVDAVTMPIFRILSNSGNIGAEPPTTFNGLFEAIGDVTFTADGDKFFRNGIVGPGTVSQNSNVGRFHFNGTVAYLGGDGTINLNFERINVANGTTLELIGNHTLNSTASNLNFGQLRMTDGSTIDFGPYELSGSANIRFNSNVVIKTSHPDGMDGAFGGLQDYIYIAPQNQVLEFYRNNTQVSGQSLPDSCAHLILANNTNLLLDRSLDVKNNISLGTGAILTVQDFQELSLANSATNAISGGATTGSTNYIDGLFRWATDNDTYVFPVGKFGSGAQGFTINVTGAGDILGYLDNNTVTPTETRAYCDIESHPATGGPHTIGQGTPGQDGWLDEMVFDLSSALMWDVTNPGGGITSYDITVHANGSNDISPVIAADGTPIRFLMKDGEPGNAGVPTGDAPNFPTTGFIACPTGYTLSGMTSFSSFSIHGSTGPNTSLPVELTHFDAVPNAATVALTWATASELNNDFFTVERSIDGLTWENVVTVNGAGTTTQRNNYSAVDTRPVAGLSYYRLKQTDFDGAFTYSEIRSVFMNSEDKQLVKVVNILGQTVDQHAKGLVIFIYSNGESMKIINE